MQKQDTTTANKKIDYLQKGVDNLLCLVYNASRKVKGKKQRERHRRNKQ